MMESNYIDPWWSHFNNRQYCSLWCYDGNLFRCRVNAVREESEVVKRMKRWGGLVRKEWALVKWFAIALTVINIGIAVLR